jgi:hypothetical protein
MEKRKFEIECNWFAIGERVRMTNYPSNIGTVEQMIPPTNREAIAIVRVKMDGCSSAGSYTADKIEPIPEPPITPEEIGRAMLHKDVGSFAQYMGGWRYEIAGKWSICFYTKREALEDLVIELRKRIADANKKEQS